MPIKSPPITAASSFTVLYSHRFGLCNRPHFLSLNRPSSANFLTRRSFFNCEAPLLAKSYLRRHVFVTRAADSTQPSSTAIVDKPTVPDDEFTLAKCPDVEGEICHSNS